MVWFKRMTVVAVALLLLVSVVNRGRNDGYGTMVSPAQAVVMGDLTLVKSALCGEEISFCVEDFETLLGRDDVDGVTITSLPSFSAGELYLGTFAVFAGQYIDASDLSLLRFVPAHEREGEASFTFRIGDGEGYKALCTLYHCAEVNYAPTAAGLDDGDFAIQTYRNISYFGRMAIRDPEGDDVTFAVVSYPKKGVLTLSDRETGEYVYTPVKNFSGTDRFRYAVTDKYGNVSEEITVKIEVVRSEEGMIFSDLIGDVAHNSAIAFYDAGLMGSYEDAGEGYFAPEISLTRAEWIALCMKAVGIAASGEEVVTVFCDDSAIPTAYKGYIAAAYECGYIDGFEVDGLPTLAPEEEIGVSEAALLVGKILTDGASSEEGDAEEATELAAELIGDLGLDVSSSEEEDEETVVNRRTAALLLAELLKRIEN